MLKPCISFFLTALVCVSGLAQVAVELTPNFKKGEAKKYLIKYTTKSPTQAPYQIFNSTLKEVVVKITEVRSDLIDFEWTYLNVVFTDSVPQFNPVMDLMNTLTKGLTVKYTSNNRGVIKSITNYKEITAAIMQRTDTILARMANDKSVHQSTFARMKFQFSMMFANEKQIDMIAINDIFKFHELYGRSFQENHKLEISSFDPETDKYEFELVPKGNGLYELNGSLIDSFNGEKRGIKKYVLNKQDGWLVMCTHQTTTGNPISIFQKYEIVQYETK